MPLLSVKTPANVIVVFKGFADVINLDVIDKQKLYDLTFGRFVPDHVSESDHSLRQLREQKSDSSIFESLGYTDSNLTRDLIIALVLAFTFVFLVLVICLLKKYCYHSVPIILKRPLDSI